MLRRLVREAATTQAVPTARCPRAEKPFQRGDLLPGAESLLAVRLLLGAGLILASGLLLLVTTPSHLGAQEERWGRIVGSVVDAGTRQPIPGATVAILDTPYRTTSDQQGRFDLVVPIGTHTLTIEALGFAPFQRSDVVVRTGQPAQVLVQMEARALELRGIVVGKPHFSAPKRAPTSMYEMNVEEIRRAPGGLGDVGRLIQAMPGVVPTSDQRNDLVVRGGSPVENLILVDHVEVPNISHFGAQGATGGPVNMINADLIRDARFWAGAFPAEYGNRLSSVLEVFLRDGNRDHVAASGSVTVGGATLVTEGPMGEGGSWLFSATRSHLDLVIGAVGFTAVPHYSNYQAKVTYEVGDGHRIWFTGLGGTDRIHLKVREDDLRDPSLLDARSGGWRNVAGFNWQHLMGGRGFGVLGISEVVNAFDQEVYDARLDFSLVFRDASRERETTLRYDLVHQLEGVGEVTAGVSVKRFGTHLRLDQPLGVRNPYSAEIPRTAPLRVHDRWATHLLAAYLQGSGTLGRRLDLTAGLRADRFGESGAVRPSPRLGARYHVSPSLSWSAGVGRYHQQPPLIYVKARPENSGLLPMRADHYVTGLSYQPAPALRITAEVFHKVYAAYPVSLEHPQISLANLGDDFSVATQLWRYESRGSGRSSGIELYLQQRLVERVYGQISYTYSRTRHGGLDGLLRRGSFDIPHVLTVMGGFKPGRDWEISSRFTFASGRPLTPLDLQGSEEQNRPIFDLTRVNTSRSPPYHRLDLQAERRLNFHGWSLLLFAGVQNAYDRRNVFQYVWNPKTRQRVAVSQIAFLPILGITAEWGGSSSLVPPTGATR